MLKVRFVNSNSCVTTDAVLQMVQDDGPTALPAGAPKSEMTWEEFRNWNVGKANFYKEETRPYCGGFGYTYRMVLQ